MKASLPILSILLIMTAAMLQAETKVPSSEDVVEFSADPLKAEPSDHFKDFKISRADLMTVLHYDVVTRDQWAYGYSHVAFGTRTGIIVLKDKTKIQWMVCPGGLACLTFPDKTRIYLVKSKSNNHAT